MQRSLLTLLSISASTLALAAPAQAQTAQAQTKPDPAKAATATPDATADEGAQIVVIGSRATNRTLAESPVPIDVISSDALSASGLGETNKILNQLVPSFNFPQPSITDGTDVVRPASLRGLSPDQTLVLVNGKRRHVSALININGSVGRGSAAVDLNTIPALAIDRIEVLRDGAASQYGSDAIAGVINIQLKRANHGGKAQVSYGKYVTTEQNVANLTGLALTNGQPTLDPTDSRILAANYSGEKRANDGDLWTLGANIGIPIGPGFVNITGEYRDRDNTDKTPLCIHRAPLGTHERFIGFLIEHYAGNFPLWLAPDQVRVITLNDDAALIDYAQPIVNELRANMVRVDSDFSATPFKAKISNAEQLRVHTMLVIGGRDMEAGAVSVRLHHGGPQGAKPKGEVVAEILASIKERRA